MCFDQENITHLAAKKREGREGGVRDGKVTGLRQEGKDRRIEELRGNGKRAVELERV